MATEYLSDEAIAIINYYGEYSSQWDNIVYARNVLSEAEYQAAIQSALSAMNNVQINQSINGSTLGYAMSEAIPLPQESLIVSSANSNYQVPAYGNGSVNALIPANFSYDTTTNQYKTNAGAYDINGNTVASVFDRVSLALKGITLGAKLGVKIDEALYNADPEWWDEHLPTINPQTWTTIAGENKDGQKFIQTLFGIKDTGMTAYVDEKVLAYYYELLRDSGAWGGGDAELVVDSDTLVTPSNTFRLVYTPILQQPMIVGQLRGETGINIHSASGNYEKCVTIVNTNGDVGWIFLSKEPFTVTTSLNTMAANPITVNSNTYTFVDGYPLYYYTTNSYISSYVAGTNLVEQVTPSITIQGNGVPAASLASFVTPANYYAALHILIYQTSITSPPSMEGVEEIEGATQYPPTNITGQTPQEILPQLKQQYPDLFSNPIFIDRMNPEYDPQDPSDPEYDPDLSRNHPIVTDTYVPVPWPYNPVPDPESGKDIIPRPISDPAPEPISPPLPEGVPETDLQTQTDINPIAQPDILVNPNPLNDPNVQPQPNPEQVSPTEPTEPPVTTPPDTGTGIGPIVVAPTGSASSLWAIYNPTQSQLNSFGAWLWSSDFVDQLKRLFNDPMQAIIGVHKIFVTPPTGSTATIVCGYLDSQVSSKTVSSQYTELDCGTVSLREYFGNAFDYAPYTRISCFLPFIGVVPLDVSEVMRASINITYGVDVLTGACIAMIKVIRDTAGAVLYTYTGSCAVRYPISSGSYAGILSGLLTGAAGVAMSAITGSPAPLIYGATSAIRQAHTDVQHSGAFTGEAGAMGPKIPYLIIERPQVRMAGSYPHMQGVPANYTTTVGSCSGLIKCKEVHLRIAGAFKEELEEIERILKEGLLIDD